MNIEKFANISNLAEENELKKVELLAYFHLKTSSIAEFTIEEVSQWLQSLSLARPNTSRLRIKLQRSPRFVRSTKAKHFKLQAKTIKELENIFTQFKDESEEIETIDSILPLSLYSNTRGYIERLAKQINASYENNIFDGCAVLMRRLLEVLLILSYENKNIKNLIIDDDGNYKSLNNIIKIAENDTKLGLSRNSRNSLDDLKKFGNFSAHKIHYNARKSEVKKISLEYRATVEELLYKSGLKT